jgi:hypothetical protein
MTTPAKLKLTIYQGATFRKRLMWRAPSKAPIDLTGCTARIQARVEQTRARRQVGSTQYGGL